MCTRVLWPTSVARVVGRTMDWEVDDEARLEVSPRGRTARAPGVERPLEWTAAYGSVSVISFGVGVSDGVNERGLGAHLLYLEATGYPEPDGRPELPYTHWVRYVLDTCETVAEALAATERVRIAPTEVRGSVLGAHLAIEDASGDSAIVELLDGRAVVHHGPEYLVMANDPPLDAQLANRARYRPFGGELPPPGDILSKDRFVRASYYLGYLPDPADARQAIAGVLNVMSTVIVPFGAPYPDFGVYPTWWTAAADLTDRRYVFGSVLSPSLVWLSLEELDLSPGTPVRTVDPGDPSLVGDVAGALVPV